MKIHCLVPQIYLFISISFHLSCSEEISQILSLLCTTIEVSSYHMAAEVEIFQFHSVALLYVQTVSKIRWDALRLFHSQSICPAAHEYFVSAKGKRFILIGSNRSIRFGSVLPVQVESDVILEA